MSHSNTEDDTYLIALLDDNNSTRNLAKATLEQHVPCEVKACSNSSELLKLSTSKTKPDLYLLDVDLGKQSGIAVCLELKSDPETQHIPIVFLSNYKDPAKRVAALKAGGVDYLDKPFYPEELVTRIKTHLSMHRLRIQNVEQISEQQALLRVLCHDLVNPIFAAHSLLELRQAQGRLDDATVTRVIGCCQSALDVILHVRTEHNLVKKDKQFQTESILVSDAFNESARTLGPRFAQKEVRIVLDTDDKARININRVVLVHNILNNLLTNALKFSHPKSDVILKSSTEIENGESFCTIEVIDKGIGMPPHILNAVFDEDAKVSRKGTESEEGTGFGMPLVKRYVEKSQGTISIRSFESTGKQESGTTVRMKFKNQE